MYCAVLKLCGAVLLTGKKLESGRSILFCWTKKQQEMPSAPKPTAQRGEKLRSLWARLQCVHLLRRHRFRRKTQHHMNNVSQKMRATPMVQTVGEGLYALGFSTEYAVVRAGRRVRAAALWVAAWFAALAHDLMVTAFPGAAQVLKDLFGPIVLFVRGCGALLVHAHRIHREKGLGAALKASAHYLASGGLGGRVQPHGVSALCAGGAGQRPDRGLCGQRDGL